MFFLFPLVTDASIKMVDVECSCYLFKKKCMDSYKLNK